MVCGNTLALTRLWQSCLATDTAENSVLQLRSGVERHLMLSMTQDLFSFFLSLALCPVLVSPTPQTLPRGSGLFSQPSPSGFPYTAMVSLRWIFSRLQSSYGTVCLFRSLRVLLIAPPGSLEPPFVSYLQLAIVEHPFCVPFPALVPRVPCLPPNPGSGSYNE